MIVTLNSDNPADAELIERLFAPAVPADAELSLDLAPPAPVAPVAAEAPATVPPPPFVLPEPPAAPPSVDASGLPWDARIHSESKATVADGTWRKRRGVDPELVKQVEAELRGESPAATEPSASAPTVADIPAPPAPAVVPPPPAAVPLAPAPAPEAAPAPETAPARTLTDLSAAVAQGKLKMTDLIAKAQEQGCADVVALTNNPLALAAVIAFYDQQGLFQ